jgi:hypothetical protein
MSQRLQIVLPNPVATQLHELAVGTGELLSHAASRESEQPLAEREGAEALVQAGVYAMMSARAGVRPAS